MFNKGQKAAVPGAYSEQGAQKAAGHRTALLP
jgi:hypothetical protein